MPQVTNMYYSGNVPSTAGQIFTAEKTQPLLPPKPIAQQRKLAEFNNQARLSTLPAQGYVPRGQNGKQYGRIIINIPHLPENIELPRRNVYDNKGSNAAMPDGLFIYSYTDPLEISLEFSLHAFDDLCPEGAKTLLNIAAGFHALVLPVSNDVMSGFKMVPANEDPQKSQSMELKLSSSVADYRKRELLGSSLNQFSQTANIVYPPACSLALIKAGARGLGINCTGFVKDVSVTLHGPFLQTADAENSFNLPSAATYRFTFVHNPSYTNLISGRYVNATSPDIFEYFYNTAHLSAMTGNSYIDVNELSESRYQ